jgi:outer membrane biosynthesis protein TonB
MRKKEAALFLACIGLVTGILACNAPTTTPEAPRSDVTPATESPASPDETAVPSVTQISPPATPTTTTPPPTVPTPTETPVPTPYPTPSAGRPTPAPPASTGPLDFPEPTRLDSYRPLTDGGFEATITLRITGGAPPYIVHHDLDTFTTEAPNPAIVFDAQGCSALVHTIIVESADGQRVQHDYWIPPPWCD